MAAGGLVAERQILFDTINVCWSDEHRFAQGPAAFRTFALQQMAFSCASAQNFAGCSYLEAFGHCLSGFNAFGTSHTDLLSLVSSL